MLSDALYTILSGNSALTAVVSTRIYPAYADQTVANPCVIFEIGSQDPEYDKDGAASVVYTNIEIDIFTGSYREGHTIAALVKTALDQYSGTVNSEDIDLIMWEGTDDGVYNAEREEFQTSMGFRVRTK